MTNTNEAKQTKYIVALHPIQQKIFDLVQDEEIDINKETLRSIGNKVGAEQSPQKVKHHLHQLVKYGILNIINGKYQMNLPNE